MCGDRGGGSMDPMSRSIVILVMRIGLVGESMDYTRRAMLMLGPKTWSLQAVDIHNTSNECDIGSIS